MFFSISKKFKDNFIESVELGELYLNVDAGWETQETQEKIFYFKGYADNGPLKDMVAELPSIPEFTGNFCCIVYDKQSKKISIKSDKYRSFPIFIHSDDITNLIQSDNKIFANNSVDINQDLSFVHNKFNVIGKVTTDTLPFDEVCDRINEILESKTKNFLSHNTTPIKTFMSGGVDSLLVFTYLNKFSKDYTIVKGQHLDFDKFWMLNSNQISSFWGYKQIHHWDSPTILTSGAPGDEFMLRSPYTSDEYLKFHCMNLMDTVKTDRWKNSLHSDYFLKSKLNELYVTQAINNKNENLLLLHWNLCNIVINDFQHWHLGKTLTWTPLRDIEIFKLILRLPLDDAMEQIFNSKLSLTLAENNFPGSSAAVSDKKNTGNVLKNLYQFYKKIELTQK